MRNMLTWPRHRRNVVRIERVTRIGAGAVERAAEIRWDLAVDLHVLDVGFHAERRGPPGRTPMSRPEPAGGAARGGPGGGAFCAAAWHHCRGACACGCSERDAHEAASADARLGGGSTAGRRLLLLMLIVETPRDFAWPGSGRTAGKTTSAARGCWMIRASDACGTLADGRRDRHSLISSSSIFSMICRVPAVGSYTDGSSRMKLAAVVLGQLVSLALVSPASWPCSMTPRRRPSRPMRQRQP